MAVKDFEIEGFEKQKKQLERLMTTDPRMRELVQLAIRKVLTKVRKALSANAQSGLQMDSDPRHAYKAVRSAVYKRILGGNINILSRRRAGQPTNYQKPRKGLPKRGGNRWGRSDRTVNLEGYEGMDRGFILRFLNAGTFDRAINSYTDKNGHRHSLRSGNVTHLTLNKRGRVKYYFRGGNRGSIASRNWFGQASQHELMYESEQLQNLIDDIIDGLVY